MFTESFINTNSLRDVHKLTSTRFSTRSHDAAYISAMTNWT